MANNNYNREFNVTYRFNADVREFNRSFNNLTSNIKAAFQSVQNGSDTFDKMTIQMHEAVGVAAQLRQNLGQAFNTSTGRLDFTQFTKSMRQAGYEMQDYVKSLQQLGPAGETAFKQLGNAILNSEIQMKRAHPILDKFVTSLGRVALYQFSTKAISMFTSSIREAFQFTQELNRSLNDIRIVTKMSTDEMASFALKANEAAQSLSSTTTAYTDASLIYFQQGLSEEEAIARTNVTLKMANVTGESVKTISNDLTAIWNNFDDGSKSLEYYADVMTKLGATTASSSKEIATGLEKFAPIAQAIGLSYEYAASALATVSAETRASADVVGTAFKTIFARLESLKLGETLEDGVGLTKYTSAVEAVGVSVMDTNGEMRKLDDILKDIGAKWQELDSAQKSALANTVAGVRQYAQFMALMENWDKVEMNVDVSLGSEGELQKQQNIYAESWEAASKRVKDTLQSVYMMLLDDDAFIDMLNNINEIVKVIGVMIKTIGGLPGLLSTISNLILTIKGDVLATSLGKQMESMFLASKKGIAYQENQRQIAIDALREQAQGKISEIGAGSYKTDETLINAPIKAMEKQQKIQHTLLSQKKQLTEEEKGIYQALINNIKALSEAGLKYSELSADAKAAYESATKAAKEIASINFGTAYTNSQNTENAKQQLNAVWNGNGNFLDAGRNYINSLKNGDSGLSSQQIGSLSRYMNQYEKAVSSEEKAKIAEGFNKLIEKYEQTIKKGYEKAIQQQASGSKQNQEKVSQQGEKFIQAQFSKKHLETAKNMANQILRNKNEAGSDPKKIEEYQQQAVSAIQNFKKAMNDATEDGGIKLLDEKNVQGAIDAFTKMSETGNFSNIVEIIEKLNSALGITDDAAKEAKEGLTKLAGPEEAKEIAETGQTFVDTEYAKENAARQVADALDIQDKAGKKSADNTKKNYEEISKSMMTVARGISGVFQVVNTLRGAISTLSDDSIGPWEKMLSIFTMVPSLIMGATSAMQLFDIASAKNAYHATLSSVAESGDAIAKTAVGKAALAASPKLYAFGQAINAAMGPIGWVIAGLTALIGIITLIVSAVNDYNKRQEELNIDNQLKKVNEEAKNAKESYDDLIQKSIAFASTAKKYDQLIEQLNNLTVGGEKYKETLSEILQLQNQMLDQSPGLTYLRSNYVKLGFQYDDIYNSNGTFTEFALQQAKILDKQFVNLSEQKKIASEIDLRQIEQKKIAENLEKDYVIAAGGRRITETITDPFGTYGADIYGLKFSDKTETILQRILGAAYKANTGGNYNWDNGIFLNNSKNKKTSLIQITPSMVQKNLVTGDYKLNLSQAEKNFLTSRYGEEEANNFIQQVSNLKESEKRDFGWIVDVGQLLMSDSPEQNYIRFIKDLENRSKIFASPYHNVFTQKQIGKQAFGSDWRDTFVGESFSKVIDQVINSYSQVFEDSEKYLETEEWLSDQLDIEGSIIENSLIYDKELNKLKYKVKDSEGEEKQIEMSLTTFAMRQTDFYDKIQKAFDINNYEKQTIDILIQNQSNWQELTIEELNSVFPDFSQEISEFETKLNGTHKELSIKHRLALKDYLNSASDFAEKFNTFDLKTQQAVAEMIENQSISYTDNLDILATKLNISKENINDDLKKFLLSNQTVSSSLIDSFIGKTDETFLQNTNNLSKFLKGEAVDESFIKQFNLIDYAVGQIDEKTGDIVYKINSLKLEETKNYAQNLLTTAAQFKKTLSDKDLITIYSTTSTLKETITLHKKIQQSQIATVLKEKESIYFMQQFNEQLEDGLKTIGSSLAEWTYFKRELQADDLSVYIWLEFKHKGKDLKEALNEYIEDGEQAGSDSYLSLADTIADIFNLTDIEQAFALIGDEAGASMLKNLFSDNTEEANKAWQQIQEFFRLNQITLFINTSVDQNFSQMGTALLAEFEAALKENPTLTWDLFLETHLDTSEALNTYKSQIGLTYAAFAAESSKMAGLGIRLVPEYDDIPGLVNTYPDASGKMQTTQGFIHTLVGYHYEVIGSPSTVQIPDWTWDDDKNTSTSAMYESKKQDTSLRFQGIKKKIEDLNDEADDLRKKLNLDISLNLPEDETKYEDTLEKRIDLYKQLEQASKNYLESDKENAIKAYNELNNALGGGLADLFEGDKFNKEEFERSYIDLMNSNFAGATKESADAVEKLKEEVDYYTDSWEAAADQQKEATKALKEARQELEKWQRFDKVLDRYNTEQRLFNAQLADEENRMKNINREMQRQEQLASQSTGPQKIAYIDKTIDLLHKQTEELKEQDEISKRSINNIIAELTSLNQSYNLDIDLTNLENHKLMLEEEVYEVLKAQFEAMYGQTKSSEEINALVEEYLKKIKEANDLIQKMADNQSTIWGYEAQEQAKNYEKLVEKLNAQLTKTKNELTLISYNFSTLSSNFYTMGEAAALFGQQGEQYIENLDTYKNHLNSLTEAFDKNKISQTDYVQGLQQVFDGIMENLNSIEQLDQQVKTYYGQTLQAANAELSAHTAGIARATATLNHYLSVMQMINRQTDYASLGKVYEGLVKTTKNEYDVAVANYEMLKKQEENARQLLEQYSGDKTSKSFEIANQTWQDAAAAMDQAYSDMLSKMEAWTQAIVDNFQNTIHKLQQTLENELTDGTNFDTLITQIERLKTADDEYLTRTNQVYELNKLAREAQKQMDEQVNSVSKQRLGQFINETNALKDRNKFSNLELEIQRARYELLLAEMAVEDARNNKNKVRLQRDSEGGYGYVYTAQADEVSDAVQKYEDAQNRLYNIGLENADNYTNKRIQTAKEWFDTMVQIEEDYQNGTIESEEEYRNRQDEATQYYYQRLQNYAELYQIALHETDENVILDSWTTHTTIEGHTEKWKDAMDKYVGEVRVEWEKYRRDLTYANEEVGRTAEETEGKVKLLTTASQELTDSILSEGGLISALDTQLGAVLEQVGAYTDWRNSIKGVIEEMKKLAEITAGEINNQNGVGGSPSAAAYEGQDISRLMAANQLRKYELENLGRDLTTEESDEYNSLIKEYSNLIAARNEKMKSSEYANELTTEQVELIIQELLSNQNISMLKELAQMGGRLFDSLKSIIGLDTGGYTGEWSNDGRLAFLHQKELVLNAEDTQNILSAVGMVRQMDSLLEGFTFGQGLTPGTMQQQVTIHAEFPSVQDHNEIELAFNDLVNRASQYVMARQ